MHELLGFFDCDVVHAMELRRILYVDLAWWHALSDQRFADHWRPALNHLVAAHSEGGDTAFLVAGHTAFFENGRYVVGVGDAHDVVSGEGDGVAVAGELGRHCFTSKHRRERVGCIMLARTTGFLAFGEAVVDRAAVDKLFRLGV